MLLEIKGKGLTISNYLEDLVTKKARKLERYFKEETPVKVVLSIEKSRQICEVTVPFYDGTILRVEESGGDFYGSIDGSLKKLERMIRKHRTRLEKGLHEKAYTYEEPVFVEDEPLLEEEEAKLVRRKTYPTKPMSVEEAEMQMELLGHEFFVFVSSESNEVNILYKRKDGDYGLLEPEE